jgi:protein-tyrosine phosphatase
MQIDKIDDKLYLSGSITNYEYLKELGITAVINCRAECHDDVYELTKMGIAYYWLPIVDNLAPSISIHYPPFENILRREERVLTHCQQGAGRSASLVVMYLIKFYNLKPQEAMDRLGEIRPITKLMTETQVEKIWMFYNKEIKRI